MDNKYPTLSTGWVNSIQFDRGKKILSGKKKKIEFDISGWTILSAMAVLAIILGIMIFAQFQQRKNQAALLFVEKGATLINSFEAGYKYLPDWDLFYLQKLLMETAQQPDIDYLAITDTEGKIIADSDPSMLGRPYGRDLNLPAVAAGKKVSWRQSVNPEGAGTFEVYRGSWAARGEEEKGKLIVFVGFNMAKIEKASREDAWRVVVMAVILALIGSLAIVSLFLAQSYRLTRASLARVTVFSEALVKNLPIALLAVDKVGEIIACNEQAGGLLAVSPADAVGRKAVQLLPGPFLEALDAVDDQNGLVAKDVEIAGGIDGGQLWEVVAAAFADEDVHEGKILLARNVTDIRLLEREVARSRHLRAIASLAAGVAHEIRNPLSSIKGFAVYFRQRLLGNKEDEETADIMIGETERLNRVVSQLIDFARPLSLKIEQTNLTDLTRQTIRLVEAQARKNNVAIDIKAAGVLPLVDVDQDKIKQALLNLFLNALAAMPEGGTLSIALAAQKEFLALEVADTGIGIRKEDLPRIYDPYFTSKPAGAGLGLTIVQKIMDAHGGWIDLAVREGAGIKVTLRFHLATGERI